MFAEICKKLNTLHRWALRILPVFIVVAVMIVSMATPVSAETLDYEDYVTNITVDGDNDLVTVVIPSSFATWSITQVSSGSISSYVGATAWSGYGEHHVRVYPLGNNKISLENIPDGSVITTSIYVQGYDYGIDYSRWQCNLFLYDASGTRLEVDRQWFTDVSGVLNSFRMESTVTLDKTSGASSFDFSTYIESAISDRYTISDVYKSDNWTYVLESTEITFSISSAYREAQASGKTNKLLETIEDKLEEQGKTMEEVLEQQQQTNDKLDDIISGSQEDQDAANDFKDQVTDQDQAIQDAEDVIDSAIRIDGEPVTNWLISLMYKLDIPYANTLGLFWEWTLLHDLLLMASIFALLSFVLFGKKG